MLLYVKYGTNHPQLEWSTYVARVSYACNMKLTHVGHVCDMHTADTKTRMEILHACTSV